MNHLVLLMLTVLGCGSGLAYGERLSFNTQDAWRNWALPVGAVEITAEGQVRPVLVRNHVNAALDAGAFGGGIRSAGSNPQDAPWIADGDPATGWTPDPRDPVEKWWIELDLGRVVTAEKIRIRFAEEPLAFFKILISSGEQFFTNALVPIPGTLVYGSSRTFGFNEAQEVAIDLQRQSIRVVRIEASQKVSGAKIAEVEIYSMGDNVALGLLERGGSIDLITDLQQVLEGGELMVDGDIVTNWAMLTFHQTQAGKEVFNRIVFDLGALYWLDQIRVIGDPVGVPAGRRGSYANFFWYQVLASDGSRSPDGTLRWQEIAFQPFMEENLVTIRDFEHAFPPQKIRYLKHYFPSSQEGTRAGWSRFGLISEYQVYGEGYPAEVRLRSPLLDLGGMRNIATVEWQGAQPLGTRIEVYTRSGNEIAEQVHYFDKKGKEITQKKWEKTPTTQRGPVDTTQAIGSDWSIWSPAYTASGELFKSPSPRQYVQVEVRLVSDDPQAAATVEGLHLNVENPIALQTAGEVYPQQARPGQVEEFTYFIWPTFGGRSQGFDRVSLQVSVPVAFTGLQIGEQEVPVEAVATPEGFVVNLPSVVRVEQLVQLSFRATIYQNRTRFDAFLSNSRVGGVLQRVDEGDASGEVASESISISLPLSGELLANLEFSSRVLTPNGDGVGDEVRLEFDALKLLSPRPVEVAIYDLAGRPVRRLVQEGLARHYRFAWDGLDQQGQVVAPGTYLWRIAVEGDSKAQAVCRAIHVVY
ncbi:MAG: hypothetical protein HYW07_20120 [Candidatus Latescibacteria bacterium]|nr:hypothetical protein [Candidatus Latescibacterota bacterium]